MTIPGTNTDTTTQAGAAGASGDPAGSGAGGTTTADVQAGATAQGQRPTTADLSPEVLKLRLDQERERGEKRAQERLFAQYGVTSQAEFDAKLKRYAELDESEKKRAAEEDEKKRASMSSEERLRTENEQLRAEVANLKSQLAAAQGRVESMKQGQVVRAQAAEFVDPDFVEEAELLFAANIRRLKDAGDTAAIAKYGKPGEVRAWFRDLVAKKPKMAKPAAPAGKPAPPPKRPITTGAAPARAVPPAKVVPAAQEGKTLRPGQKNTMNDKEAAEAIAKKFPGVRVPGLTNGARVGRA